MKNIIKNKKYAILISIFCMFLWGSAFPMIKLTYAELNINSNDYFSMIFIAGLRFFFAGVIVAIILYFYNKKELKHLYTNFNYLIKLALLAITISYLFFYIGTANASGMKSAILTSSSTFLVVIFSHFFLNEKFNRYKLIAIILGLAGVVFSNLGKSFDFNFSLYGEGFLLLNAILGSLGTIYIKKRGNNISPFVSSSGQFLYGGFLLILIGLLGMKNIPIFNLKAIILIFYGALISSVAFTLWYFILQEYEASEITFLRLFIPFFGTFLSAIILKEQITLGIIIGLILVIIGIIIINKSNRIDKKKNMKR